MQHAAIDNEVTTRGAAWNVPDPGGKGVLGNAMDCTAHDITNSLNVVGMLAGAYCKMVVYANIPKVQW